MSRPGIVVLIPAYNEAGSIGATIEAALNQSRRADRIVVIPNGCTDATAAIARTYPVTVLELPRLEHRKSEALNTAWSRYGRDARMIVCLDADTVLPANAFADWWSEFRTHPELGGSSSKFTMQAPDFLSRLQKAEFATWTDTALRLGTTSVLAGTGCAIAGAALRVVAARTDRTGPWSYTSQTEDFELTYRIRELGWYCHVSPTVRAYTDSMKDLPSLWNQRMKWQVGTIEDLLSIGVNRLTLRDWSQQLMGLANAGLKALWLYVMAVVLILGNVQVYWVWFLIPVLFIALDVKRALRIPHWDRVDLLIAATFFPNEAYMWLRAGWFIRSWADVLISKITGGHKDRWAAQYVAEGI